MLKENVLFYLFFKMKLKEQITLSAVLPKPLPIPADEIIEFFKKNGYKFEDHGRTLFLHEAFLPKRYTDIKRLVDNIGLDLDIYHWVRPIFENKDYENACLWVLYFNDLWVKGIDFENVCKACGIRLISIDKSKRVARLNFRWPIASVNAQFTIVSRELRDKIMKELSGGIFEPFDWKGRYYYLLARSNLGDLINTKEDFINFKGTCFQCGSPKYDIFYGAQCHSKDKWNGDDIVFSNFHHGLFFTKKAYKFLKSLRIKIIRSGVVLLKGI